MRLHITCSTIILLAMVAFGSTNTASNTLPRPGKGYSMLYGYHSSTNLFFVLMPGTNRTKTFSEVNNETNFVEKSSYHLKATGLDGGKTLIDRIGSGSLQVSGLRQSIDVIRETIPDSVTDASADEIATLEKYWTEKQKK